MTTENTGELDTPTTKPAVEDMNQLPLAQRHYIHANEVGQYKDAFRIYTGKRGATYIDANKQEREKPWQAVDIKQKWVEDYIKIDPSTGELREVAPSFDIVVKDENSGDTVSMTVGDLYHVPNHGPNLVTFEDGVQRPYIHNKPLKAKKDFINHEGKEVKKGDTIQPKKNMHGQVKVDTHNVALLLNGVSTIPVGATNVYISGEKDDPLQAVFKDAEGTQKAVFTPKETQRRRDVFWSYKREAFTDIEQVIDTIWSDKTNMDDWSDSQKVIALVSITAFRHGNTTKSRRLPANDKEKYDPAIKNTGERTGIGASSLLVKDVIRTKKSVIFKFLGKHNVPQEHEYNDLTEEGRRVLAIVDSAMKGKGSEDRLFKLSNQDNKIFLNSLVAKKNRPMSITALGETYSEKKGVPITTRPLLMKDFRTWKATTIARNELAKRKKPTKYKKLREEIGLIVGTKLGHKTYASLTTSQKKKDAEKGTQTDRAWKNKSGVALSTYIDPQEWDNYRPKDGISKLMKLVKDLQTLSKAIPTGAIYSSTEPPPKGTVEYYTEHDVPYWIPTSDDAESDEEDIDYKNNPDYMAAMAAINQKDTVDYDKLEKDEREFIIDANKTFVDNKEVFLDKINDPTSKASKVQQGIVEHLTGQSYSIGDDARKSIQAISPSESAKLGWSNITKESSEGVMLWGEELSAEDMQAANYRIMEALNGSRYAGNDGIELPMHHLESVSKVVMDSNKRYKISNVRPVIDKIREFSDELKKIPFAERDSWPDDRLDSLSQAADKMEKTMLQNMSTSAIIDGSSPTASLITAFASKAEEEGANVSWGNIGGDCRRDLDSSGNWSSTTVTLYRAGKMYGEDKPHSQGHINMVHETAHAVHHNLPHEVRNEITAEYVRALEENKGFISNYSKGSDEYEFFAESYAAYFTHTKKLRERNPAIADILDRVFQQEKIQATAGNEEQNQARTTELGNRLKELKKKGAHTSRLTQGRFFENMVKAVKQPKITVISDDISKIGIISPNAANLPRAKKEKGVNKSYVSDHFLKAKGKYNGRTGGITPDWTMKVPGEERDIDEWAEARRKKAEERQWGIKPVGGQHMAKTWVGSLADKGFTFPLIKQVIGSQMWFAQDGIDYIANLGINENELVTSVEKATFTYNKPSVSYAPSGRNNHHSKRRSSGKQGERYQGDIIDDEEDDSNV